MTLTIERKGVITEHWKNITAEDVRAILATLDNMGAQYKATIETDTADK